ncbi:MAG: HTH domain-containing protein [Gammaproteobacteria bacterium]|jgi:predicted transcriptional regulator|nr:HTH domain-containing protein [Gammaproteobacteria bacterium]MBT4607762.1 HTH domain-containing protein [Thiotrichales bacterium]MBT4081937.1 HTH domain-containing protein [Gammaproteobacteria bacterium]MBT4330952.1 HTH domain-containing protein [Gammaproteobacteria bacterium]MBT4812591.1 HTH domain-containing protein [Thiotrichales bacterium]
MSIEITSGSVDDFFASAKETARDIDQGKRLTRKNRIWVAPEDMMLLLKAERTNLVQYLREQKKVSFTDLTKKLNRSAVSLNSDLKLLSKYNLVHVHKESNPGHGQHKVVETNLGSEKIEFRVEI